MVAFLMLLSRRYASRGFSPAHFSLTMPCADIANYLRLTPETMRRNIRRSGSEGLIDIRQRDVHLFDIQRLDWRATAILRECIAIG